MRFAPPIQPAWLAGILRGRHSLQETFGAQTNADHPDNNPNAELYCDERFVELESLSPLAKLEQGAFINPQEMWDVFEGPDSLPSDIHKTISSYL